MEKQGVDRLWAILATCTDYGLPHGRLVAIREVKEPSLFFFTQKNSKSGTTAR